MESFMMMRTRMVRMKKWQLVKIQLKTPDHLLPSRAPKSRNDQQKFLGSWWIVMKRRKNWTRGVKCSPNYIPIIHPFIFAIRALYWNSEEEESVIIVWDRDIIVMNSPILVAATTLPPCTTQHCCTHCHAAPGCHHAACHAAQHCSALNNTAVHNQFQCTVKTPAQCKQQPISLQCNVQKCAQCKLHSVHHANLCTACTIKMSLLYSRTSQ